MTSTAMNTPVLLWNCNGAPPRATELAMILPLFSSTRIVLQEEKLDRSGPAIILSMVCEHTYRRRVQLSLAAHGLDILFYQSYLVILTLFAEARVHDPCSIRFRLSFCSLSYSMFYELFGYMPRCILMSVACSCCPLLVENRSDLPEPLLITLSLYRLCGTKHVTRVWLSAETLFQNRL